jgi:hypothetical protein
MRRRSALYIYIVNNLCRDRNSKQPTYFRIIQTDSSNKYNFKRVYHIVISPSLYLTGEQIQLFNSQRPVFYFDTASCFNYIY